LLLPNNDFEIKSEFAVKVEPIGKAKNGNKSFKEILIKARKT
jgi:hypothetical protein